jgi:hypothetical protein
MIEVQVVKFQDQLYSDSIVSVLFYHSWPGIEEVLFFLLYLLYPIIDRA